MKYVLIFFLMVFSTSSHGQSLSLAKADATKLLQSIELAKQLLRENGEFYPFGAAMEKNGQILSIAAQPDNHNPSSESVIELLTEAFISGARAETYKATALFYDVRVTIPGSGLPSDAIAAALDHQDGYSVIVLHPYTLTDNQLSFGNVFAVKGNDAIFSQR